VKRPLTIFVPHCSDLLTDYLPHGDGLVAHGFISRLARRGHSIHVAAQMVDLREPLGPNVVIHSISAESRGSIAWRLGYMRRLRALFWQLKTRIRFDLIHQLNPVFTGLSLALAGSGLPLVLGTYVARWPANAESCAAESWSDHLLGRGRDVISAVQQRQADALVLTTPAARDRLPGAKELRERIHFLPHGIDTELFSPASGNSHESQQDLSILFFANVVRRKGIFTLIAAFPAVAREFPAVRLRIAGDGPELPEAKQRVAQLSCCHQVEFLGRLERSDAPDLYRKCSVYCLPSFGEPYGGTIVEAMSCGRPVVVTDSGGPPHLVPEQGGRCVAAGNAAALSRVLIELLHDPNLRASMGGYNRRAVEENLSWDSVVTRLENIYHTVLLQRYYSNSQNQRLAHSNLPVSTGAATGGHA
jgi:glycosyltransferase involved in cell wall biosynthesis